MDDQTPNGDENLDGNGEEGERDIEKLEAELERLKFGPAPWSQDHRRVSDTTFEDENAWVLTYIDVLTLLVTVMVVMLAFAKTDAEHYRSLSETITQQLKVQQKRLEPLQQFEQFIQQMREHIDLVDAGRHVEMLVSPGKIELRIRESILFETGSADLRLGGREVLSELIPVLKPGSHSITVEGHTDNVPISNERYPSNWELSSGRATNVVRYLISRGITSQRLSAIGYADTRPVADNATADGRGKNRRVSLILRNAT